MYVVQVQLRIWIEGGIDGKAMTQICQVREASGRTNRYWTKADHDVVPRLWKFIIFDYDKIIGA
jgi:hypothetical protein